MMVSEVAASFTDFDESGVLILVLMDDGLGDED